MKKSRYILEKLNRGSTEKYPLQRKLIQEES